MREGVASEINSFSTLMFHGFTVSEFTIAKLSLTEAHERSRRLISRNSLFQCRIPKTIGLRLM